MKRFLRRAATLVAVSAIGLSALTAAATPSHALTIDAAGVASISLDTRPSIVGDTLVIEVEGSTTGQLVANTTVALQVVGVEHWQDADGQHVEPIYGAPSYISFTDSATVTFSRSLHPGSTVEVTYAAEVVGLTPTAAIKCEGEVARVLGGSPPFILKTC